MGRFKICIFSLQLNNLLFKILNTLIDSNTILGKLLLLRFNFIELCPHLPVLDSQEFILGHEQIPFTLKGVTFIQLLSEFAGGDTRTQ